MADVFVSYARSDKARVAPLVAAIEAKGWTVWWDPEIDAGQQFDDQIEAELLAAAAAVVVWTATSVSSRWVRGEAREAADRNILVPVRFDAARLPMDVRAIHTIDLDAWNEDVGSASFQDLARALDAMIARQRKANVGVQPGAGLATPATPVQPRVSICVLPFSNMSGDLEQEYFSDGISEDIITDLSKVSALAVVSRNTAFTFKGKNVDLPQVARQLKVNYVLEGSVRRAGGRVRITAQLIEAASDNHLWAERYDRDLNDIFALQDEISEAIVKALRLKLLPEEKKAIEQRGTTNLQAYNLYLMARQRYATGQMSDARRSDTVIRLCRGAIELDPNYARAWALMATAQRHRMYATGQGDNGSIAAARAIELDANLAEAHAAMAGAYAAAEDYVAAEEELGIALRLDPDSVDVQREAARLHFMLRRYESAAACWERVADLVDTDISSGGLLITCYTALGDTANLERVARRTLARAEKEMATDADNGSAMATIFSCLICLGETERAREWARRAVLIDPDNLGMRYNLACDFVVSARDHDMALEMLRPVCRNAGREQIAWIGVDPDMDPLRDDPRFKELVAEAEARLAAVQTPR
jgi:adenylate cyclase